MIQVIRDPRFFNYVLIGFYILLAVRWALERKVADTCYWLSAAALTVAFLYKH
jgi:hypothetical protein